MSEIWVGIDMGVTMISVSMFRGTKCELVLQTSPYVTFTETGEILAGERAQRYYGIHKEAPLYSIFDVMKYKKSFQTNYISHKGVKRSVQEISVGFVKDLKRQLEDRLGDEIFSWNCILSVPLGTLFYRENLKKIMSEAGFTVKRILQDSVACAVSELYYRKNSGHFLSLAVVGNLLNASLVEYGGGVQEVLFTKSFVVEGASSMNATELSRKGYQLMGNAVPDFHNELAKAEVKVYSSGYPVEKRPGNAGNLGLYASEGAAVICEALTGNSAERFRMLLLLDTTAMTYGIEIVDKDENIVKPLEWVLSDLETIPVRKYVEWECKHSGAGLRLRVYSDRSYKKETAEAYEIGLENAINRISGGYKKINISLSLDANKNVTADIINVESGERDTLNITGTYPAQSECGQSMLGYAVELWKATADELEKIQKQIVQLEYDELCSPTGKGLLMIAKQCNQFLQKHKLEEFQRCAFDKHEMLRIIEELLLIADNLEYGIRNIPVKTSNTVEIRLMESYLSFLGFLERTYAVTPIRAEGMLFDIKQHYAVAHEENINLKENMITGEVQRGYYWGYHEVIRPSKVKVVN